MKRECLSIIASLILLPVIAVVYASQEVDQLYSDNEGATGAPFDQLHVEDHYYEEYEEEIELETIEYEEVFESDSEDNAEDDIIQGNESVGDHVQPDESCFDDNENCEMWAYLGECDANPKYMRRTCRLSCDTCRPDSSHGQEQRIKGALSYEELIELYTADDSRDMPPCVDKVQHHWCPKMAKNGKCKKDPDYMMNHCPKSCKFCDKWPHHVRGVDLGVPQSLVVDSTTKRQDITWMIGKARNYINHYIEFEEDPDVLSWCHNKHRLCAFWALHGECEANEIYMEEHCGPVCNSCSQDDYHLRCPIDPDAEPAWEPGDINKMFESIVSDYEEYNVGVLSSPETGGPWIVTIDNLLTKGEAIRFIELGQKTGYERSSQVGDINPDGTVESEISDDRTSTNAWCMDEAGCFEDEVTVRVMDRIENLTGIPSDNGEYMQLLKYEPGQYYRSHHDFIFEQGHRRQGVRMLTVFLYLNEVEGGGATYFDGLDLKVDPKVGRALIWPSTLDEDPNEIDPRTSHEAQVVTKGVKYAANVWYHQYSYKEADRTGCVD